MPEKKREFFCKWCKGPFLRRPSHARSTLQKIGHVYCSNKCHRAHERINFKRFFKLEKKCTKCKKTKKMCHFTKQKDRPDRSSIVCRECQKVIRDKVPIRKKREKFKRIRASKKGLSIDQLESMEKETQGVCPICKNKRGGKMHIDHCHSTGKVRGLLCGKCNNALGLLEDNIVSMSRAITYLRRDNDERLRSVERKK